ncbi:MAG: adenylate cyclase [Flavobacteriaceae bacterium]|nr:adenylate cyclase [Flavobacteriaceae bacterium]|tara:strand:+ start:410 stop:898 length:489 start_codon:yes stop_codon:yes gene_type:complete
MIEKERKFKVKSEKFISLSHKVINIKQGYLSKDNNLTIRIRISDKNAYLCIKGPTSRSGISRFEFEKEISVIEGSKLLKLCLPRIIFKKRYLIEYKKQLLEVDVFEGFLKGLILAEIELNSESQKVNLPDWVGEEVTGVNSFYNSQLSKLTDSEVDDLIRLY